MNMYEPNLFERGLGEKEKKQLPCIIQTETVYLKNPQTKTNIPGENLTVGKFSRSKFGTIFMTHTIHVWHIIYIYIPTWMVAMYGIFIYIWLILMVFIQCTLTKCRCKM